MPRLKLFMCVVMTLVFCIMTLGYAALQERIDVEVEASIDSTYRVEITRVGEGIVSGDARSTQVPSYTNDSNNMTTTFNVGLTNDTDYITYTIEITNYSTVDIRVNEIEINKTNNNMKVSKIGISNGDIILAGGTKTFTVKIKLTETTTEEQTGTITISPKVTRLKGGLGSVVEEIYDAYVIGDVVEFAGSNWYVIEDSGTSQDYVVLLKEKVLTNVELGNYASTSTANTMAYYYSNDCHVANAHGYVDKEMSGCYNQGVSSFNSSKIKEFFDNKYISDLGESNFKNVLVSGNEYKIRLITTDELINNLGWKSGLGNSTIGTRATTEGNNVPIWVYNVNRYWTMSEYSGIEVWNVHNNIYIYASGISYLYAIRPVINLYKTAID